MWSSRRTGVSTSNTATGGTAVLRELSNEEGGSSRRGAVLVISPGRVAWVAGSVRKKEGEWHPGAQSAVRFNPCCRGSTSQASLLPSPLNSIARRLNERTNCLANGGRIATP